MQPTHYQRKLPHMLPPGATVFFTFRLAGSIAAATIQQLAEQQQLALSKVSSQDVAAVAKIKKQQFSRFDAWLDQAQHGPTWLSNPAVAALVIREIEQLAELNVVVLAYCLLANHVHLLVQLPDTPGFAAARMMQRLKGRTAMAANKLLQRTGQAFWQHESYDHVVRDGPEAERVIAYILNNPVKAGLVNDWTKWPYSHVM